MSTTLATRRPQAPGLVHIERLHLQHGGALHDVRIACELYGNPDAPAVLVLGGISGSRHLIARSDVPGSGWWPGVVGAGAPLDPAHWRLIGIDYPGGRGGSSRPQTGEEWPLLTTRDQAVAIAHALDELGIDELHAVVGASFGGMVALQLATLPGDRVRCVVSFGAAHRSHPFATALRSVQRRIVRLGIDNGAAQDAVAVARSLAVTTYRSAAEFEQRFSGAAHTGADTARFPVDSYLDHHGHSYRESFPATAFLTISQCLDLHAVDPGEIQARCHLVCFDSDTLVPPDDVRTLATALGTRAQLTCIPTHYGHDGFLKEIAAVTAVISAALTDAPISTPALAGAPPPLQADGTPATRYAARASCNTLAPASRAVRAAIGSDTQHGAVIPPLHLSSTYTFAAFGEKRAYDYTRSGNPTRDNLATAIADLEGGAAGVVTATGMAAVSVTLQLLQPGDLLIAAHDGYGGTYRLLRALARRRAFDVEFADLTDPRAAEHIRARRPRMVWIETPSNPLLRITDIAAIAAAARDAGALCVADNTFLSPALQNPLALGADIVVHSTTKYLNGHSDVVGGAIVTRDLAVAEEVGWWANCVGATGAPFDSYLTLRGVRTLHARTRVHEENAHAVVDVLHAHPAVRQVYYPGLPTHPGHDIARRQQRGFGAMISCELHGGIDSARNFVDALRCFSLAESLGGVESLVAHPATMTHAAMDAEARHTAGISDSLLRLSVGIEDARDLTLDLTNALGQV